MIPPPNTSLLMPDKLKIVWKKIEKEVERSEKESEATPIKLLQRQKLKDLCVEKLKKKATPIKLF